MKLTKLVFQEIIHNSKQTVLTCAGILLTSLIMILLINMSSIRKVTLVKSLKQNEQSAKIAMDSLQNVYTTIAHNLGHTLRIISSKQNSAQLLEDGWADEPIDAQTINSFQEKKFSTIKNLSFENRQKALWPEMKRQIFYISRYKSQGDTLKNSDDLEPGYCRLGYQICWEGMFKSGQKISINGKSLVVEGCDSLKGSSEDIGIYLTKEDYEKIFNREFFVNEILAQNSSIDNEYFQNVKKELETIPEVKVIAFQNLSTTQVKILQTAFAGIDNNLQREKEKAQKLITQIEQVTRVTLWSVITFVTIWLSIFFVLNIRKRRHEIGILRTLGISINTIRILLLLRGLLITSVGSILGIFIGLILIYNYTINIEHFLQSSLFTFGVHVIIAFVVSVSLVIKMPARDPVQLLAKECI